MTGVGVFFSSERIAHARLPRALFPAAFVALCAAMILRAPGWLVLVLVYLQFAVAVCGDLSTKVGERMAQFSRLGQLTYSIYLWHPLFILVMLNILGDKLLQLRGVPALMLWVPCFAAILVVATLSYRIVEVPARAWITGRRRTAL